LKRQGRIGEKLFARTFTDHRASHGTSAKYRDAVEKASLEKLTKMLKALNFLAQTKVCLLWKNLVIFTLKYETLLCSRMRDYVLIAMRDIYEIARADEEELLAIAKQRIENFSILKRIYGDDFLSKLVRHKIDSDNLLLCWLATDDLVAIRFFQEIEENLELLQPEGSIEKFETKLKQRKTIPFESTIAELEFATEYKRRGYRIELEPSLPNGEKADFCASKDSVKIYFEVMCIFWESSLEENAIMDELFVRLGRMDQPFVIGIDLKKSFRRKQTVKVAKHIQKKLSQFERVSTSPPFSFVYPESGEPIVEIDVMKRLPEGEKGYISGGVFGGGVKGNWNNLRSKISSGISQLHPDYPGVIVVQPHGLGTGQYDIQNALLGDLAWNPLVEPELFRWKDRIFAKNKNKRLSVVIYCKRSLQESGYIKKKFVYHNPHAKTKLSPDVFKGENVTQFIPIKLDNGTVRYKQINTRERVP